MRGSWLAAGVHLFTALGAVCALLATFQLQAHNWPAMFGWLGVALIIDGVDGMMARAARVEERLPRFSGERLDLVVDYLTYVFVPVQAMIEAGFVIGISGRVLAALMLLSALYHFADTDSKAADHSFIGFPALWNLFAFYVFAFDPPLPVVSLACIACIVLTFVPMKWVHPFRVQHWRLATLGVLAAWSAAAIAAVFGGFPAAPLTQLVLALALAYGVGISLVSYGGKFGKERRP